MYNSINELLLFSINSDTFISLSIIVAIFIVFIWCLLILTSKKDLGLEYVVGFIVLIYGIFVFYPYMQNSIKNSFLLFDSPAKNIGLTANDLLVPVILVVISLMIMTLVRPAIDKFYRIYGHQTFLWISFRKKVIDLIVSGKTKKTDKQNEFRFWKFWKTFQVMFYTSLSLFLVYGLLDGCMNGIWLATQINNLFYVVVMILLFNLLYKIIGGIYMSGFVNQPFKRLPIRFQKREELLAFVSNNTEQDTKNRGDNPLYVWPLKIIIALASIIVMWFLYEVWKAGITRFFGNYQEFVRLSIYGIGDRGGLDFIIHFLWFPFKSVAIILFSIITLNKFIIPDMRIISNLKDSGIVGPKSIYNTRGVIEYCDFEHSSSSILAIFGWIIASVGIFYPVVLGIFMFFMIFRSYSAIDLYNLSQPELSEKKKASSSRLATT